MPAKYRINNDIVDLLASALVRSSILVNRQELPEHERRATTYALNRELEEAIGRIRRYD